ncbi:ABC transporter substrate-binding protein [Rhodovastum atsumiense]|uniref:ABC transporter substrate-binding protein n=2 Tax=Rhodovastum atsumiense TaxID=504468 RepID=A0A5M6IT82_9PROT|nr:ABC transporter substrate-binding protein [Rhodovastum atsumiense]
MLAGAVLAPAVIGRAHAETATIRIAQQFGIGYLPLIVVKERNLFAPAARALDLPEARIDWVQISGAAGMNDALFSGNLDIASAGSGPLITVWARTRANLGVRGVAALGSLPVWLTTSNPAVRSVRDFGPQDRIALPAVRIGYQAVLLQMAAEQAFGAGQYGRLDALTVSMSHPDATIALLSGRSEITANFGGPPFQQQQVEQSNGRIRRVVSSYDLLDGPCTFNVLYATDRFRSANPRTLQALIAALDTANAWIAAQPREAAELYVKAEKSALSPDFVERLLRAPENRFTTTPEKFLRFAAFQHYTGQIREKPAAWQDLFFPEIHARAGS